MSFLKKLFGGGQAAEAKPTGPAKTIEHNGFTIHATPYQEGGQWQLCGRCRKDDRGGAEEPPLRPGRPFPWQGRGRRFHAGQGPAAGRSGRRERLPLALRGATQDRRKDAPDAGCRGIILNPNKEAVP